MTYVTLKEKFNRFLGDSDEVTIELPIEMLKSLIQNTPLSYFVDTAPYTSIELQEAYSINNVTGFFTTLFRTSEGGFANKSKIVFKNSSTVSIQIDNEDFFNLSLLERKWTEKFSKELKTGDLCVILHPQAHLIKDLSELLEYGYSHVRWSKIIDEGSLVTVLDTFIVDNTTFIKVLCESGVYWCFSILAKYDNVCKSKINYHYI